MKQLKSGSLLAKLLAGGLLVISGQVFAIPDLQLDIVDGVYVGGSEESVITTDPTFTLRALLKDSPASNYRVSVALEPHFPSEPVTPPDFGSFSVDGTTYSISDMLWGTPPPNFGDLPSHGVFDAYYLELDAFFSASTTVAAYNVQDGSTGPGTLMYDDFLFDVTGLLPGYQLHFDFYEYEPYQQGKKTKAVIRKVPFSHDAGTDVTNVSEPGVLALLGLGLIGVGLTRHRSAC